MNDSNHDNAAVKRARLEGEALERFHAARSKALNAYAGLEMHMAATYSHLLGADRRKAYATFAAVTNNQKRLGLLRRLTVESHPGEYDDFIEGFTKRVASVSDFRNRLVHWIVVGRQRGGEPFDPDEDIFLIEHPDIFGDKMIFLPAVTEFEQKSEFYSVLIFYFGLHLQGEPCEGNPGKTPWPDIFKERPVFPPPKGHQLDRFSDS